VFFSSRRRHTRFDCDWSSDVCSSDLDEVDDARRYDMGERDHFVSMEMAAIGMEMMAGWGNDAIVERLSMLTGKLAEGLGNLGVRSEERRVGKGGRSRGAAEGEQEKEL